MGAQDKYCYHNTLLQLYSTLAAMPEDFTCDVQAQIEETTKAVLSWFTASGGELIAIKSTSCVPKLSSTSYQPMHTGNNITLTDLQPGTAYNCTIETESRIISKDVNQTARKRNNTCSVQFRTYDELGELAKADEYFK